MSEWRLFPEGTVPEFTTEAWYSTRDRAPHLEQPDHRPRLEATARLVNQSLDDHLGFSVVDLGAGDGGLLSLLDWDKFTWGYDLQPSNIEGANSRPGVNVMMANVLEDPIDYGDIAVATEFLEHLVDPHAFVRQVAEHCPVLICSSPWNETADSHYQYHCWAWDPEGYAALLETNGYRVINHELVGAFQVIRGVRK